MHKNGTAKPALSTKAALKIICIALLFLLFIPLAGKWISSLSDSPQSAEQPNLPHSLPPIGQPNWSIPCVNIAAGQSPTTIRIGPDQWSRPIKRSEEHTSELQ